MEKEKGLECKENPWSEFYYHHSRPLMYCLPDLVVPRHNDDDYFKKAYLWLQNEVGFYPLFLAVGNTERHVSMTGYQNQWRKKLEQGIYRQKGEIENAVLFSYRDIANGFFMDDAYWHIVLNSEYNNYRISKQVRKWIFKPSWRKTDWLRLALKNPLRVEIVVPSIDLGKANLISVRNTSTKKYLEAMGFTNVQITRIPIAVQ